MTQSLDKHKMTMGQTLCSHRVDRQHQDLVHRACFDIRWDAKVWHVNGQKLKLQSRAKNVVHDVRCFMLTVHV